MPALTDAGPVNFILPAHPLRRYLSTYHFLNVVSNGTEQEDFLYPEWASVRFTLRGKATGNIIGLDPFEIPATSVKGPTGKAALVRFQTTVSQVGKSLHLLLPAVRIGTVLCLGRSSNQPNL